MSQQSSTAETITSFSQLFQEQRQREIKEKKDFGDEVKPILMQIFRLTNQLTQERARQQEKLTNQEKILSSLNRKKNFINQVMFSQTQSLE